MQYPGVGESIRSDLRSLEQLATMTGILPECAAILVELLIDFADAVNFTPPISCGWLQKSLPTSADTRARLSSRPSKHYPTDSEDSGLRGLRGLWSMGV